MKKKRSAKGSLPIVLIVVVVACVVLMAVFSFMSNKREHSDATTANKETSDQFTENQTKPTESITQTSEQGLSTTKAEQSSTQVPTAESTAKPSETTTKKPGSNAVKDSAEIVQASAQIKAVCGNAYTSDKTGRKVIDADTKYWNLLVVNKTREYDSNYKPNLSPAIPGSDIELDSRVAPYYTAMYNAAKKEGIYLTPFSGYRRYSTQERNYNNLTEQYMSQYGLSREEAADKAATVILPPGTSEHNLGLAMDICNVYDSFANTDEYAWLTKHAQDYGFILRYTKEKQPITGIVPEPWHWRFVGVENAKKIKASGLCLEEYLDSLGIEY